MTKNIISKKASLNLKDGSIKNAFVAMPDDKVKHPSILIFQEVFGVNAYIRDIVQRFAHLGFISIAPVLFYRSAHEFEENYNYFEGIKEHLMALTTEGLINDIEAAYLWLVNYLTLLNDNIASIGFCMGGKISFLANTSVKLKAAISFYGGGIHALLNRVEKIQAPLLFFWVGLYKHIDENQISLIMESLKQNKKN